MRNESFPVTGRRMCGAVEVSTSTPFVGAVFCHCKRCQRRSGTTRSMTALCPPGAFAVTVGEDKVRVWDPGSAASRQRVAKSGNVREQSIAEKSQGLHRPCPLLSIPSRARVRDEHGDEA